MDMTHEEDRELREIVQRVRRIERKVDLLLENSANDDQIAELTSELQESEKALQDAVDASGVVANPATKRNPVSNPKTMKGDDPMANPVLAALEQQVRATTDAETAAIQALNGVADRIQAAVTAALANGATKEELAPVQSEVDALKASSDALGAAVVANTPVANP